MALTKELKTVYLNAVVAHFIKHGFTFNSENVKRGIRDLVYFRDFFDTIEETLDNLYPKEG